MTEKNALSIIILPNYLVSGSVVDNGGGGWHDAGSNPVV